MPTLSDRLAFLNGVPAAGAAQALAAAVSYAESDELNEIAEAAIALNRPEPRAALIRQAHRLAPPLLERLVDIPGLIDEVARSLLTSRRLRPVLNAIELIARRPTPDRLVDVAERLKSRDETVEAAAADALLRGVTHLLGEHGRRTLAAFEISQINRALLIAAEQYARTRQPEILLAIAIATPGTTPAPGSVGIDAGGSVGTSGLEELLSQEDHRVSMALRGVPGWTDRALVRVNLLRWLGVDRFRSHVQRHLKTVHDVASYNDVLSQAHLLLGPSRRKAMRRVDRPTRCLPDLPIAVAMNRTAQIGLPAYIAASPIPAANRSMRLADLVALPSSAARVQVVRTLYGRESQHALEAMELYCFDRSDAVATLASRQLLSARRMASDVMLKRLGDHGRARPAHRARCELAKRSVDGFCEYSERLRPHERHAAAVIHLEHRAGSFLRMLADQIQDDSRDAQRQAIRLVRTMRIARLLDSALAKAAVASDSHVASAAIAALGESNIEAHASLFRAALDHDHPRVRANAVEALGRLQSEQTAECISVYAEAADNRVRANAIAAICRVRREFGGHCLRRMLRDERSLHRTSAIWAAQRLRLPEMLVDLEFIAQSDDIALVRDRAKSATESLRARVHDHADADERSSLTP